MSRLPTNLSAQFRRFADELDSMPGPAAVTAGRLDRARVELRRRRLRTKLFPAGLFWDPAWPMLLHLYIAEITGKPVSVSGLSELCELASATGIRWIQVLAEAGLVCRAPDPKDARRSWVRLTDQGRHALQEYLDEEPLLRPTCAAQLGLPGWTPPPRADEHACSESDRSKIAALILSADYRVRGSGENDGASRRQPESARTGPAKA